MKSVIFATLVALCSATPTPLPASQPPQPTPTAHATPVPNSTHVANWTHTPNMTHPANWTQVPNMTHAPNWTHVPNMTHAPNWTQVPNMTHAPNMSQLTMVPNMTAAPNSTNQTAHTNVPNMTHVPPPNRTHVPNHTHVPQATRTPPPMPPPKEAAHIHAILTLNVTDPNTTALWHAIAHASDLKPETFRLRVENVTGGVKVHVYVVGGSNSTEEHMDESEIIAALGKLANASAFWPNGTFPLNATEWEYNPTQKYICDGCTLNSAFQTSPAIHSMCEHLREWPLPIAADPAASPFKALLAKIHPPPPPHHNHTAPNGTAPNGTAPNGTAPAPNGTAPNGTAPNSTDAWHFNDTERCWHILEVVLCTRAYPLCHAGANLKACRSDCDALRAFCSPATIDALANMSATFATCAEFAQPLNSPTTPCITMFDDAYLKTIEPTKPCALPPPPLNTTVAVPAQVANVTIAGPEGVRVTAWLHLSVLATPATKTDLIPLYRDELVKDIVNMFGGMHPSNFTISLIAGKSAVTNGTAVPVFFDRAVNGTAHHTAASIQAVLEKGVATEGWLSRWRATTVTITVAAPAHNCSSCPEANFANVHPTCKAWATHLYGASPLSPIVATLPNSAAVALTTLGSPAIASLGAICSSYLQTMACGFFYSPCNKGFPLRPCTANCANMARFCPSAVLLLVANAPESKALGGLLDCRNETIYVAPGSAEPCFDAYDTTWIQTSTAVCSAPVAPKAPVNPPVATIKTKPAVTNPETIHICGGCDEEEHSHEHSHDHEEEGPISCPANLTAKFEITSRTECIPLPAQGCQKLTRCGDFNGTTAAYYSYEGTSSAGTLTFFSDAECKTNTTKLLLAEAHCENELRLIPGGYAVAVVQMSFQGKLNDTEKENVEKEVKKLPLAGQVEGRTDVQVEFRWGEQPVTGRRQATTTTLDIKIAAANNVVSTGSDKVGASIANDLASQLTTAINEPTFSATLTSAAGNKQASAATLSAAPEDSDDDSSSIIGWIILIVVVVIIIIIAVAVALCFLVSSGKKSKAPKVKSAGTYDDEEDGYAGRNA